MTFCLGITVEEGLIGIADTRVLTGNESMVAKKIATYQGPGFSFFVMTSGLRSLRDKVLLGFDESLAKGGPNRDRLYRVVISIPIRCGRRRERIARRWPILGCSSTSTR